MMPVGPLSPTTLVGVVLTAIAAALRAPQRLVVMHFFNPVPLIVLVEVIGGLATDPEPLATAHADHWPGLMKSELKRSRRCS